MLYSIYISILDILLPDRGKKVRRKGTCEIANLTPTMQNQRISCWNPGPGRFRWLISSPWLMPHPSHQAFTHSRKSRSGF